MDQAVHKDLAGSSLLWADLREQEEQNQIPNSVLGINKCLTDPCLVFSFGVRFIVMWYYHTLWCNDVHNSSAAAAESLQACPTLCDSIDGSPPGSPIPGILQARTLEWVAISFSNAWKRKVKVKSLSRVRPSVTPWTAAHQGPSVHGIFQARVLEWGATAFSDITPREVLFVGLRHCQGWQCISGIIRGDLLSSWEADGINRLWLGFRL